MTKRLLVVGAGPIGLAAAVLGRRRGLDVTVLERDEPGSALLRWGETRFFTPFAMNAPRAFLDLLDGTCPDDEDILTGPEMVERVLRPVAASLGERVLTRHRVVAIGRSGLIRGDLPNHPLRAERPFRVVADTDDGERTFEAEVVLDASGVTGQPTVLGAGGPAPGERAFAGRLIRHLADVERARGKKVLVIGHGHSAATALLRLADGATRITWATRSRNKRPCEEIASDRLLERARICSSANALAQTPPPFLSVERRAAVESIEARGEKLAVALGGGRVGVFDEVLAFTGHRPDLSFVSELALETSPVTEGAGRLAKALASVTDSLNVPRLAAEDLASGEPGFALVGAKSYGRSRSFLLKNGLEHVTAILDEAAR